MTHALRIKINRPVDFRAARENQTFKRLVDACLVPDSDEDSRVVAATLIETGVDAVIFPSVQGGGDNVVVYCDNAPKGAVVVVNRGRVLAMLQQISQRR